MPRKYIPRVGTIFPDREALETRLENSGWQFEGHGAAVKAGTVTSYNVGVVDEERDVWLMVFLVPTKGGIKVAKVEKLRLSDYGRLKSRMRKRRRN